MAKRKSKRLVIDTSVARAAGARDAIDTRSKQCRDLLTHILTICHQVVMTPELRDEWQKHQSHFTNAWRVAMVARKKMFFVDPPAYAELLAQVEATAASDKLREAMFKDFLLIRAALETDRTIISGDEKARQPFTVAAQTIAELKAVVWVNPHEDHLAVIRWLERGAEPEPERCLGF